MEGKSHQALTVGLVGTVCSLLNQAHLISINSSLFILMGSFLGSTLPDIDLKLKIGHRRITHSLFFILLLLAIPLILYLMPKYSYTLIWMFIMYLSLGIAIGAFCHILEDSFSKQGVIWFYPINSIKTHFPIYYTTGHLSEYLVLLILALPLDLWVTFYYVKSLCEQL